MDTQLQTLSKVFTEKLFRIPDYQRGYAWNEKQLNDFWTDITQLEAERNHYTGVLTLEEVPDKLHRQWHDDNWIIEFKNYQPYYIVDGQQRLTTAIILLQSILEKSDPQKKLNYTSTSDIQRKFIFDSKDDGISRSYIFGYEKDNPSYEFLKTRIFNEHSSSRCIEETAYTHNLEYAKQFFTERILDFSHKELEELYKKITQQLLFNIFTISEEVDVCVAFETMNNRGKPLSHLELLKNRLIYLSLKFKSDIHEKEKLRRTINDCWKTIYHSLGKNKATPLNDDKFLFNHFYVYFGKELAGKSRNRKGQLREIYFDTNYSKHLLETRFVAKNITNPSHPSEEIKLVDIYSYVQSLQKSVDIWYKIHNPFDSAFDADVKIWLDKHNRLDFDLFLALLIVVFQKSTPPEKTVPLLKTIERYLFILSFVLYRAPRKFIGLEPRVFNIAAELEAEKITLEDVIKTIDQWSVDVINQTKKFTSERDRYRKEGFYNWSGIRYFLFEYNLSLQERSKTSRPKIFWQEFNENRLDHISIEHIYPQKARSVYWKSRFSKFQQKRKSIIRNSLGNLAPLSSPKNSSLSNKSFPEKVDGVKDKIVGFRFGSYSENEIAKNEEWGPKQILERGVALLDFMEKRWQVEIGDRKEKVKLLGLEFLEK